MGEKGETVRVSDPLLRVIVSIVGALAAWALIQVSDHGKILSAMGQRQTDIERAMHVSEQNIKDSVDAMRHDIRRILDKLENRP